MPEGGPSCGLDAKSLRDLPKSCFGKLLPRLSFFQLHLFEAHLFVFFFPASVLKVISRCVVCTVFGLESFSVSRHVPFHRWFCCSEYQKLSIDNSCQQPYMLWNFLTSTDLTIGACMCKYSFTWSWCDDVYHRRVIPTKFYFELLKGKF